MACEYYDYTNEIFIFCVLWNISIEFIHFLFLNRRLMNKKYMLTIHLKTTLLTSGFHTEAV